MLPLWVLNRSRTRTDRLHFRWFWCYVYGRLSILLVFFCLEARLHILDTFKKVSKVPFKNFSVFCGGWNERLVWSNSTAAVVTLIATSWVVMVSTVLWVLAAITVEGLPSQVWVAWVSMAIAAAAAVVGFQVVLSILIILCSISLMWPSVVVRPSGVTSEGKKRLADLFWL